MAVDIPLPEEGEDNADKAKSRLNNLVAVTIALLATAMGVFGVKSGNISQAMQEAQADKIDYWAWYQARNIREEVLRAACLELRALAGSNAEAARRADECEKLADEQSAKKAALKTQAEGFQKAYEELNTRDDQFDFSDAALAIAIALLAITSLTQKKWLYFVSLVPAAIGVVMGLAGFFGWNLNPGAFAKWLGA